MSGESIIVLIYHHHKLLVPMYAVKEVAGDRGRDGGINEAGTG
jgi:hypothetical protein